MTQRAEKSICSVYFCRFFFASFFSDCAVCYLHVSDYWEFVWFVSWCKLYSIYMTNIFTAGIITRFMEDWILHFFLSLSVTINLNNSIVMWRLEGIRCHRTPKKKHNLAHSECLSQNKTIQATIIMEIKIHELQRQFVDEDACIWLVKSVVNTRKYLTEPDFSLSLSLISTISRARLWRILVCLSCVTARFITQHSTSEPTLGVINRDERNIAALVQCGLQSQSFHAASTILSRESSDDDVLSVVSVLDGLITLYSVSIA